MFTGPSVSLRTEATASRWPCAAKIELLRESVNLVEVALGVFPNGLAHYKVPSEHKA
jgi:hypothetical protein